MLLSTQNKKESRPASADPTGIPAQMRSRFERLTGCSYEDVRVHYHSSQPARAGARAFTQGNQVYVGPGEEACLPHELAHVFQQKEGRVPADGVCPPLRNSAWNNDGGLEREADRLAQAAMTGRAAPEPAALRTAVSRDGPIQRKKYVFFDGEWRRIGTDLTEDDLGPVETPEGAPDEAEDGDTYDDETGVFTNYLDNIVRLVGRIQRAIDRESRRLERDEEPRHIQEQYSREPMEGHTGKNRIWPYTVTGPKDTSLGKSIFRQKGDSTKFQPRVWPPKAEPAGKKGARRPEKTPSDYQSLVGCLDGMSQKDQFQLSQVLLRYQTSQSEETFDRTGLPDLEPCQQKAVNVLGVLTLIESHLTRALRDSGKTMRGATRAAGQFGFHIIFGDDNAAMLIVRRQGNQLIRDAFSYAEDLRRLAERKQGTDDSEELEEIEDEIESIKEKVQALRTFSLIAECLSDSSDGEDGAEPQRREEKKADEEQEEANEEAEEEANEEYEETEEESEEDSAAEPPQYFSLENYGTFQDELFEYKRALLTNAILDAFNEGELDEEESCMAFLRFLEQEVGKEVRRMLLKWINRFEQDADMEEIMDDIQESREEERAGGMEKEEEPGEEEEAEEVEEREEIEAERRSRARVRRELVKEAIWNVRDSLEGLLEYDEYETHTLIPAIMNEIAREIEEDRKSGTGFTYYQPQDIMLKRGLLKAEARRVTREHLKTNLGISVRMAEADLAAGENPGVGFTAGNEEEEGGGGGGGEAEPDLASGEQQHDYVTFNGVRYDLLSNQGENGSCLWNLFRASGISDEDLIAAVQTANESLPEEEPITYDGYVLEDQLPQLVLAIEDQTGMPMTVQVDTFYYDGRYVGRRIYGRGRGQNFLKIGLAANAADGMGHFVMGEPDMGARRPGQPFYPA